jgi:hypothetical protein
VRSSAEAHPGRVRRSRGLKCAGTGLPLFGIALVFIAVVVIFFVVFRVFSCFVFLIVVFIFDSEIKSREGNGFHERV